MAKVSIGVDHIVTHSFSMNQNLNSQKGVFGDSYIVSDTSFSFSSRLDKAVLGNLWKSKFPDAVKNNLHSRQLDILQVCCVAFFPA